MARRNEGKPTGIWEWMEGSFPDLYQKNVDAGGVPGVTAIDFVSAIEQPPEPMPLPPEAKTSAAQTAKTKSVAKQRRRRGRASTILTALNDENEGRLGG